MPRLRFHISIILMVLAILAVTLFQSYWLYKNYNEESASLGIRSNMLFRNAVLQCQAEQLGGDSIGNFQFKVRSSAAGMINVLREKALLKKDSLSAERQEHTTLMISVDNEREGKGAMISGRPGDSTGAVEYFKNENNIGWVQVLKQVDSLQDTIRVADIEKHYKTSLQNAGIPVSFRIHRKEAVATKHPALMLDEMDNTITVGFSKPLTFSVTLENTMPYLIRKMRSRIIVSLLLVGLTVVSFIVLWRNLSRQRRLTRIKNDFISNITHELKTPIATVSVALEALRNFNAMQDPVKSREYLSISENEMQRLSLLVDRVLKLSMFENHQMAFKQESFDLQQLLQEIFGALRLQFEKYGADVRLDAEGSSFTMMGDRLHVASVFYNLLDNALKYSSAHPVIQIHVKGDDQGLHLRVCDNGIGIPPEYRTKVFEKFFRVPTGDRHNAKGYGLGLSYVAEVVKGHGGHIHVEESMQGEGTCFILDFPASGYTIQEVSSGKANPSAGWAATS